MYASTKCDNDNCCDNVATFFIWEFTIITFFISHSKFQRCPFNVGKPFFRWGYVILSQNKSDLVVF